MGALSTLCAMRMQDWVPTVDDEGAEMDAQLLCAMLCKTGYPL